MKINQETIEKACKEGVSEYLLSQTEIKAGGTIYPLCHRHIGNTQKSYNSHITLESDCLDAVNILCSSGSAQIRFKIFSCEIYVSDGANGNSNRWISANNIEGKLFMENDSLRVEVSNQISFSLKH